MPPQWDVGLEKEVEFEFEQKVHSCIIYMI